MLPETDIVKTQKHRRNDDVRTFEAVGS